MTFLTKKSKLRTVKPGDPLFTINDGLVIANRAGFDISQNCPNEYRMIILECMNNGWLKPVAHMTAEEHLIETLKL
jgi:hypothetical protein